MVTTLNRSANKDLLVVEDADMLQGDKMGVGHEVADEDLEGNNHDEEAHNIVEEGDDDVDELILPSCGWHLPEL